MAKANAALLARTLAGLGAVATRSQLLDRGISGKLLTRAVRTGAVVRLRRAHYALPTVDADCAAAVALGGRLGAISAARTYGWWDGLDERLHVSWPQHGNVAKPGRLRFASQEEYVVNERTVVSHWRILRGSPRSREDVWRETPEETLAQALLSSDRLTAIACADSAIHTGILSTADVAFIFSCMPRRIGRWHRFVDGNADSGLESIVRVWLIEHGIPFVHHPEIPGVGEVDFLVGDSLIIETDSTEHHANFTSRNRDYARDNVAGIRGYLTVRLGYPLVMFEWAECERRILAHLGRRDHHRTIR